jgi:creatinine amidohydrolase
MPTHIIADMTWEAFRDAVDHRTLALIPMGSTELEGPHLPLGVDTLVAQGLAGRLGDLPGVLIGPTLPIGYSEWFNPFPGTISLSHDTLPRVLADYCGALARHGIRRIVFLNAHRGNNAGIEVTAHRLLAAQPLKIGMLNVWKLANDLTAGGDLIAEGRFTHAGEIMTSLVLALRPDTVVTAKIAADGVRSPAGSAFQVKNSLGDTAFRGSVQTVFQDIREITASGVMGDPRPATAAKGRALLDLLLDYIRAYLEEFQKLDLTGPPGTTERP